MLTMNYILGKKYHPDHILTDQDKQMLIKENADSNFSYVCLLKEYLSIQVTVHDLLRGYSGIQLFKLG